VAASRPSAAGGHAAARPVVVLDERRVCTFGRLSRPVEN
jgi:hypothetical protein